jgi:hypothetical protein
MPSPAPHLEVIPSQSLAQRWHTGFPLPLEMMILPVRTIERLVANVGQFFLSMFDAGKYSMVESLCRLVVWGLLFLASSSMAGNVTLFLVSISPWLRLLSMVAAFLVFGYFASHARAGLRRVQHGDLLYDAILVGALSWLLTAYLA